MRGLKAILLLLLGLLAAAAAAMPVAGTLRLLPQTDGVVLRLALSAPLPGPPRAFALDSPMRWAVDLPGTAAARRDVPAAGMAKGARVSQFDPETARIVVDLARPLRLVGVVQDRDNVLELRFRTTDAADFQRAVKTGRAPVAGFTQENMVAVPPGPQPAPDLAADSAARLDAVEAALGTAERQVGGTAAAEAASPPAAALPPAPSPEHAQAPPPPDAASPATAPPVRARPGRGRPLVVIDAGHGGKDPGAPSVRGDDEKDITLGLARAARAAILRRGGIDVKLTRDDDRFIPLGGRVRLARQWGADLFISIHADSAGSASARGASVYTLSDVASDREAARLAAKENRADLIAGVDLSSEDRDVTRLLIDLAQRDSMNASADFAALLQKSLMPRGVVFREQFHRFAGFAVLKNLGVPAVLVETGYLSNPADAAYLRSDRGRRAIAEGVADAVSRFLKGD